MASLASNKEVIKKDGALIDSQDVRYIPLFGSKKQLDEQLMSSKDFVAQCEQNFNGREEASKFFAERGWEYLNDGLLDTAVYRFNLCYLLNPENVEAYWGLGSISYQKKNYEESAKLLRKGLALSPQNATLMIDVATVQLACFKEKRKCDDIDDALLLLEKSLQIDSTNANGWLKYSIASFQLEHYDKAWEYLHKCRQIDITFIDTDYIKELVDKKEDPLGIFK
jgi:tetratricopeptide (TPR) repeat protein